MPITPSRIASDPYAPLAWATSLVLTVLQKLKIRATPKPNELTALSKVAEELRLLSEAGRIGATAGVPLHLRRSFCTFVAIQERTAPSSTLVEFADVGNDLDSIREHIASGSISDIPTSLLDHAQQVCLNLLEQLNEQRPGSAAM